MRGFLILAAVLLLGCDQITELSDDPSTCASPEECSEGLTCIEGACVKPPGVGDPDPATEREADALGKLGVERDMLESKLRMANEKLAEAKEELADAKTEMAKKAARGKQLEATKEHREATEALRRLPQVAGE